MTLGAVAAVVAAVLLALVAAWAYYTAQRLNRLHIRLDRSRDALQAALDRRCAVVAALYPQLAAQARATEEVRVSPQDLQSRLTAEAELMAQVAQVASGDAQAGQAGQGGAAQGSAQGSVQGSAQVPVQLEDASTRVMLAARFYNDAVSDTLSLRLRPSVRALRLGGTAALPTYAGERRR